MNLNSPGNVPACLQLEGRDLSLMVTCPGAGGTYCGTRFSRAGLISEVYWQNQRLFGPWRPEIMPVDCHDSVMGTAGEFGMGIGGMPGPPGYEEAKPGDCFVKIGVGILRRPDTAPYSFAGKYELVESPSWQVMQGADWIEMRQSLTYGCYGYEYICRVVLGPGESAFAVQHTLSNTGRAELQQTHYSHNFIVFDQQPVGPDYELLFPFAPNGVFPPDSFVFAEGRFLKFRAPIPEGKAVFLTLSGFGETPGDNQVTARCRTAGLELKISGDRPVCRYHFFAVRGAVCPEPFVAIDIAPDATCSWEHRYELSRLT